MNLRQHISWDNRPDTEVARIKLHGAEGFEGMRRAGRLAAEVLDFITPHVVPGITTDHLDRLCHGFIVDRGAIPAPLNYRGFPRSICTSMAGTVTPAECSWWATRCRSRRASWWMSLTTR